jgi:hypothetical protein
VIPAEWIVVQRKRMGETQIYETMVIPAKSVKFKLLNKPRRSFEINRAGFIKGIKLPITFSLNVSMDMINQL